MSKKINIAICVATYKRPKMLEKCLSAINHLQQHDNYELIIIIVDNDIETSGRTTVEKAQQEYTKDIHYSVEAKRGIASARNRMLDEAMNHKSDLIAFLDDDEFPETNWLVKLLLTLEQHKADVVTGPVISLNEEGANVSTTEGKYLTGSTPRKVSTNNVLFKSSLINKDMLRFDLKLNFTGGEDFDFFDRSLNKGNVHVWANDAVVYETIPKSRTTTKYLFFRHFTGAINNVMQYKMNHGLFKSWGHFLLKSLGKLLGAILAIISWIFTLKKEKLSSSIVKLASAAGYISGLLNIIVERYK